MTSFIDQQGQKEYLEYNLKELTVYSNSSTKAYETVTSFARKYNDDLKLLAVEILFLNCYFEPSPGKKQILIYIGSAPGTHLLKLCQLFPELEYHLYDLNPHDPNLINYAQTMVSNIKIYTKDFSRDDIPQYQDPNLDVYVITDIRHRDIREDIDIKFTSNQQTKQMLLEQKENLNVQDMLMQKEMMQELKPKIACLKFRLPHYYEGTSNYHVEYFKGTPIKMIFNDIKSTEARLIVSDFDSTTQWNFKLFSEQMNYFNYITRERYVKNVITNDSRPIPDVGNLFDNMFFYGILRDYLKVRNHHNVRTAELLKLYNLMVE